MSNDQEYSHQLLRVRFLQSFSLATAFAIVLSSGLSAWAEPSSRSEGVVPEVKAQSPSASLSTPATSAPEPSTPRSLDQSQPKDRNVAAKESTTVASGPRFFCQLWKGQYTVMYSPEKRAGESFPWAVPQDLGGGWNAERRCNEISRRLEEYRPDGLQEMSTATENGYNTVCATTEAKSACRIVFTVPPGQDPIATRNAVFGNLTTADSGQMTQGVNTFVGNSRQLNLNGDLVNLGLAILGQGSSLGRATDSAAINLKPYLAPSDGGTGAQLTNGVRLQKGLRLNPEQFR